jgi:histidinol-phosphate phosphatase family protein
MKALLLAAGKGTRLGEITQNLPKPLLKVHGEPVLGHLLKLCARHGVDTVCINTHHQAKRIREAVGDGSAYGLSIRFSHEETLLGTSGALNPVRKDLADSPFFVLYGDNFMSYDLSLLAKFHREKNALVTVALFEKDDVSQSGIAVLDSHQRITHFVEKPRPHEALSRLVNCGLYVVSPEIFEHLPEGFSDFGKDLFPALLEKGLPLFGLVMDAPVVALDTPALFAQANGNKALFIDRDGLLNRVVMRGKSVSSPRTPRELEILPEGVALCRRARREGFLVVVVTNQPDVDRGHLSPRDLDAIHGRIREEIRPDRIEVCGSSDDRHARRKPNPGMILDAAKALNVDLSRSVLVGDSAKDLGAGRAAGIRTVLLQTEYNKSAHGRGDVNLDSHAAIAEYLGTLEGVHP